MMTSIAKAFRPSAIDDGLTPVERAESKRYVPSCKRCDRKFADRVIGVTNVKHLCGYCRPLFRRAKVKPHR